MKNAKGFILLHWTIISILILAGMFWYSYWTMMQGRVSVHRISTSKALNYADSGVSDARSHLTRPDLQVWLAPGSSQTIAQADADGRYESAIYRNALDSSLVDIFTTGYFYLSHGNTVDPVNNKIAQIALVQAKIKITNTSAYMMALPNGVTVYYGTDFSAGSIYAGDLTFGTGSGPHTKINQAFYYGSYSPQNYLDFVDFVSTNATQAQQLTNAPNFPFLDLNFRTQYQGFANGAPLPSFTGVVSAPPGHVYFTTDDIDIGLGGAMQVSGVFVIYTSGSVRIHNDIVPLNPQSWVAILAEQDIHIADVPSGTTSLTANFFTNGSLVADPPVRPTDSLRMTGGVTCLQGITTGNVFVGPGARTYTYGTSPTNDLLLPYITELLQYQILKGKS